MTSNNQTLDKLGKYTEQLEKNIDKLWNEHGHYYADLKPYQRGILLIALTLFLLFSIYYLTKKETPAPRELTETEKKSLERLAEERILRRAEFLRRLQH